MCNDYERHLPADTLAQALADAGLNTPTESGQPVDAGPSEVRVGDLASVICGHGNGITISTMRWGFAPARKRAAPVFNFRGEGRRFRNGKRCIVPASAFFEFTGSRSPKSKWRFHVPGVPIFGVAGLWHDEPAGAAFTMLTVPPGEDVRPFHDRQIAVLAPPLWASWIYLDRDEATLLAPLVPKTLCVQLVREGAETPPNELIERAEHRAT